MNKLLFLLIISFSWGVLAEEIDTRCYLPESLCRLQLNFEASDKDLNDVYRLIINKIKSGGLSSSLVDKTDLKQSLVVSQRAWLRFKELNCDAYYTLHSGGRQRNEARMECEIEMTNQRIQYLKLTYL